MAVVTQIQIRRGTAAQWTSANPTLASGEWGFETDTNKAKIGNGSTVWTSLSYIITGATGTVTSVVAGTGLSGGTITTTGTIAIDSTVATLTGTQTLTNKTLTTPIISSISNSGTVTIPTGTVTLATLTGTETFTNKTLTAPVLGVATGTSFNSITGLSSTTPIVDGTAAVGTATTTARADHVHPTDTSRAATSGTLAQFAATTSAQLAGVISDETGSGALVFATSPSLTTPAIGVATGTSFNSITGLSSTTPVANGTAAVGVGTTTARGDHVHPTTGLGLTASGLNQFAATTSAQLAGVISDETGSGALVFGTSPTITGGTFADAVIRQTIATPTFTTNNYTLVLGDQGDILLATNGATAGTITIPLNSSVAFPSGTQITLIQTGAGQITIQGAGGVTVASTGATSTAPKLRVLNSSATLIKTNTDAWYVVGDIS